MKTIHYRLPNGTKELVEVSDEFYAFYENIAKAEKKSNRRYFRRNQSLEHSLDNGWDVEDLNYDLETKVEQNEWNNKLYKAISTLPPKQQLLIEKVFYERISQQEIATQEGVTRYAIHKRLTRILRKLKKLLS